MAIARVNRQARQPQSPVEVDTSNPITRGLVRALVCEAAGIRDLMFGTGIDVTGTYLPQATEYGYGRRNNTITLANYTRVGTRTETVSAITIVWAGVVHRIGGTTAPFFRNVQTIVQATGATGPLWSVRFGATLTVNSTMPIKIGSPTTYVYRKAGAIGSLFVDGVPALLNVTGGTSAHSAVHGIDGNVGFAQSNDITTNVMLIYDRPLSDAESRALSINPWQVFRPVQRRIYFDVGAGGGTSPVSGDQSASYAIRGSVSSDQAASYAIRSSVSADLSASYNIQTAIAVSSDLSSGYEVRTSAQSDASAGYAIRASVQADSSAAYEVRSSVQSDVGSAFVVRGAALSDTSASYLVRTNASADLIAAYEIQTASGVSASFAASYNVRAAVQSDASAAYDLRTSVGAASEHAFMVRGLVSSDLDASYTVDAPLVPVYADLQAAYLVDGGAVFIPSQFVASVPAGVFSARAPAGEYSATVPSGNYRPSI